MPAREAKPAEVTMPAREAKPAETPGLSEVQGPDGAAEPAAPGE
jgi:hypothetical protein